MKLAIYKCTKCNKEWSSKPGYVTCTCGCISIVWINWDEFKK